LRIKPKLKDIPTNFEKKPKGGYDTNQQTDTFPDETSGYRSKMGVNHARENNVGGVMSFQV
jgi:hypothetical protein